MDLYPDPDPKAYERPMPNAAIEGEMIPGDEHPEWIKLRGIQAQKQVRYINEAVIILACSQTPGKEDLILRFEGRLFEVARWVDLPESEWDATLLYAILSGKNEPEIVSNIASGDMPLTQDEVIEGVAQFFRPVLPGKAVTVLAGKSSSIQ